MRTRWLAVPALTSWAVAALGGCAASDDEPAVASAAAPPSTAVTTAVRSQPPSSAGPDPARQVCDAMKTIQANGYRTSPQELYTAGELGGRSSNADISREAQLLADYAAMTSTAIGAGGDPAQHMRQLGGMVQDLTATCRENGYP
jgi:hypothetical protein